MFRLQVRDPITCCEIRSPVASRPNLLKLLLSIYIQINGNFTGMNTFWRTGAEVHDRLSAQGFPYCIVKSYGGDPEYSDSNIDVLTTAPLLSIQRKFFEDDFLVTPRDRAKNLLYERNKLMLTPKSDVYCKIHLHSSIGWHNLSFIDGEQVLENAQEVFFEEKAVCVLARSLEARAFVLHIIFEQFKKNAWDNKFLTWSDYECFASEYQLDSSLLKSVHESQGLLELEVLKPIWSQYYRVRGREVSRWNLFLHRLLVFVDSRRRKTTR